MLGILDDYNQMMTLDFKQAGDLIYLLGVQRDDLGCSEYLRLVQEVEWSNCPHFDLEEEYALQQTAQKVIAAGLVQSAHDVSEGGVLVALLESGMPRGLGFTLQTDAAIRKDAYLFGEAQSRIIVSVQPEQQAAFERFLQEANTPFSQIGTVAGAEVLIDGENWGNVESWKHTYNTVLNEIMQ
jgi:phosphoribosylformylglycinamidine synthase